MGTVINLNELNKTPLSIKYKKFEKNKISIKLNETIKETLTFLFLSELEDISLKDSFYYKDIRFNLNLMIKNLKKSPFVLNLVQADILLGILEVEFLLIKECLDFYESENIISHIGELHIVFNELIEKKNMLLMTKKN